MKYENEFRQMIQEWGEESSIVSAIEEMSELTKELCKYLKFQANVIGLDGEKLEKKRAKTLENVKEEIADVLNVVKKLALMFGNEEIDVIRDQKVQRTMGKLLEKKQ